MALQPTNPDNLPIIKRTIASTVVFTSDGAVVLGRKARHGGGVYAESWHLPGGGAKVGENLLQTAQRELAEEVQGLDNAIAQLEPLPQFSGRGATTKTLADGRRVWCQMEFNYFRLVMAEPADVLIAQLKPGSDFVELKAFTPTELAKLPTVPGGIEGRIIAGDLTATKP